MFGKTRNNNSPTVFVVDDDAAIRDSLRLLVESLGKRIETYCSAQEFLNNVDMNRCGCLLLDIQMPGINGMELQKRLNQLGIAVPIIFITGHGEIPMAVNAMKNGAFDFIQKPFSDNQLLERIEQAMKIGEKMLRKKTVQQNIEHRFDTLTKREKQILEYITEGRSNKYIALDLNISQRTVEAHRAHIMEKMHTKSLPHLVRMAEVVYDSHYLSD